MVWDLNTGVLRRELAGFRDGVTALTLSPDGRCVAAAGGPARWMKYEQDPKTNKGGFVPQGEDGPGVVMVWDAATGREVAAYRGHTGPVFGLAISTDGSTAASCGRGEDKVRLWNVSSGDSVAAYDGAYGSPVFAPDGRRLILYRLPGRDGRQAGETVVLDWRTGCVEQSIPDLRNGSGPFAVSGDGRMIVRVGNSRTANVIRPDEPHAIQVIDAETGEIRRTITESAGRPQQIVFGPRTGQISVVVGKRILHVWDLTTGRLVTSHDHGHQFLYAAAFTPDARQVALVGASRLDVWDVHRLPPFEDE